jgi:cytochrome o ubiquinol oxidase operon protein cyoD
VLALALGILVVFPLVGGSIWIMDHLTSNMMPADQMIAICSNQRRPT